MPGADHREKARPWYRRRRFLLGATALVAPVGLFFASNLWLMSGWGRTWLGAKLTARIGMPATVEGASWSPWSGFRVRGLAVDHGGGGSGEPLLKVESVRVWPVWSSWLRRRGEVHSIEIESPRIVIPAGFHPTMLPDRAGAPRPVDAPTPWTGGGNPNEGPPMADIPLAVTSPPVLIPPPPGPVASVSAPSPVPVPTPESDPPPAAQPGSQPTGWIHIRNGSVTVVGESGKPLLAGEGIHVDVPASGDEAGSEVTMASLRALGTSVGSGLRCPLRWKSPMLFLGPATEEIAGVETSVVGKLALAGGIPIQLEVDVPVVSDPELKLPPELPVKSAGLRASARFSGIMAHPGTWNGDLVAEGKGIEVDGKFHSAFDRGWVLGSIRGGVLMFRDARLIGDEFSLLANATFLPDGRGAGVLRMVARPDRLMALAAKFEKAGKRMNYGPLGTPDRAGVDLSLWKDADGTGVRLGDGGDGIDVSEFLRLVKDSDGGSE